MTSEFDVRIGLQFVPGAAADQATAEANRIRGIFSRMGEQLSSQGILDPRQAQKFGDELGRAIRAAMNQDIRNSPVFQAARGVNQAQVRGVQPEASSRFLSETIKVAQAEITRAQVALRSLVPVGTTQTRAGQKVTGFPTEDARTKAQLGADAGLNNAYKALEKAQIRYAAEIEKEVATSQASILREEQARARATIAINQRTDVAQTQQRRQAEADAAKSFPVSYPTADSGSRVGRAEEAVNAAERSLAVAEIRRAEVYTSATRSAEGVLAADNRVELTSRALATAQQRLADEQIRAGKVAREAANKQASASSQSSTSGGGIGSQFGLGFRGVSDRPFAEQIGQAFKFSIFYGTAYKILFALTQTFSQTLQEGIQFQQSVSDLRLATGRTAASANDLANEVGKEASSYGFAPSQGVEIAARAQGYYGTANIGGTAAGQQTQDLVGKISSRVVNQLAFASGKQPDDIQGNLAAITQAYGLGYQSQAFIGDLDAYFSRQFGAAPGDTIGAVAESGTVGRAAGFSPAEVSAIAADIIARTGASDSATGGFLAQIFSRSGEGSLNTLTSRYGIDQQGTLAQQFAQLAKVYAARPDQRDDISAAFGRGKVQNAVIALLQDYPRVQAAAKASVTEAPGALGRATNLRLDNLGGQIQQTIGTLKEFANELGQSGVLDILGSTVVVFRDLVEAGDDVLQLFNQLPRPMRDAVVALTALALAARVSAAATGEGAAGGALGTFLSRGGLARASTLGGQRALATAAGDVVPLASREGLALGARGAIAGLGGYGVAGAVLGDAILWGKFRDASQNFITGSQDFTDAVGRHTEDLSTPEGLQSRASTLAQAAADRKQDASGFFASIVNQGADAARARGDSAFASQESKRLQGLSLYLTQKQADAAGSSPGSVISGFDSDSLTSSLTTITQAGGTAKTQFDALAESLNASARAANRAKTFDPKAFAGTNAEGIFESILKNPGFAAGSKPNATGRFINAITPGGSPVGSSDLSAEIIRQGINPSDIQKRLQAALAGVGDPSKISPDKLTKIASEVVGNLPSQIVAGSGGALSFSDLPQIQDALTANVKAYLQNVLNQQNTGLAAVVKLSGPELTATIDQLVSTSQATAALLPDTDYKGKIAQATALLAQITAAIKSSNGATPEAASQLAIARRGLADAQFAQLEAERKAAQQSAGSASQIAAVGQSYLHKEISAAVKGNDPDLLAKIIAQSGTEAVEIARNSITQALDAARAAEAIAAKIAGLAITGLGADAAGHGGSYAGVKSSPAIKQLQGLLAGLGTDTTAASNGDVYQNGGDVPGITPNTAADIGAAAAQAHAARVQGQIAKARADIVSAKAAMTDAKGNAVAYNNALAQYYQARQELTDAIISYRENLYLLGHDITDPLTQARAALKAAAAQLNADRSSGAAPDQLATDKVALEQAQASAESTAFQQRLSAVQTADELGRISHQKYLAYLDHEHDRLKAIGNRTYQQQQELNQVDGLIKSANDALQGEFNFGDIHLPTPYQVRRKVEELYGPTGTGGQDTGYVPNNGIGAIHGGNAVTNNITIDGADTGLIKKLLKEILGGHATTTTTSARHT